MNRQSFKRFRRRIRSAILCPVIRLSIVVCGVVPRQWSHLFFSSTGSLAYYLIGRDRRRTITHLTEAFGDKYPPREIRSMARQVFRNLGHSFADFMISQSITTKEQLGRLLSVEGAEYLDQAYRKGRGVVALTCHLSAFELAAVYCALHYRTFIVGARIDDPRMNDLLLKSRTRLGATNIYKGEANLKLFRALKQGALLGLLIDQDISVKSVFVDFFGRPASTPIGPALLAQRTGAACIAMAIRRTGSKLHMTITPEIPIDRTGDTEADLLTNTRRFSEITEAFIREAPTQWVWMHRRWRTKPEQATPSLPRN
ncbi:MAG: lipid A biosynthesis lauroyl acyltransferase [Verrucomicrobia bacterium]|nr:MAG: lipid A biosynthesis lauroyl acyltransferase [Verrucomicrobiota bacterium]